MKPYRKRAEPATVQLDLFYDLDVRERRSAPRAVKKLADRFGLSIAHATAIATANGYGIR